MKSEHPAFESIKAFSKTSGLSTFYIRKRVRESSLPCLRSGTVYLINVSAALEVLDKESRGEGIDDGNEG